MLKNSSMLKLIYTLLIFLVTNVHYISSEEKSNYFIKQDELIAIINRLEMRIENLEKSLIDLTNHFTQFQDIYKTNMDNLKNQIHSNLEPQINNINSVSISNSNLTITSNSRKYKVLNFFQKQNFITSKDVEQLFNILPITARKLCQKWTQEGFFVIINYAKKNRKYTLSPKFRKLLDCEF